MIRIVLALTALLAIAMPALIVATAPRVVPQAHRVVLPRRVVPPAELPPVEPVKLQLLPADEAREINAEIPFVRDGVVPARPFRLMAAGAEFARAVDCLAAAAYYEAGDDAVGQRAVVQVVLNRLRHPAFPKTVCGVVFQGSERTTGCQFTFTCDGALARVPRPEAWARARQVASAALTGSVYGPVGYATHYHTNWVVPYWSASLDKIAAVDTHLFFRWTGWWGTPPAFNRRNLPGEPAVAKLAWLSPAHRSGVLMGGDLPTGEIGAAGGPIPIAEDPNTFLVTIEGRAAAAGFPALAMRACGNRGYCKFMAWAQPGQTPVELPITTQQLNTMIFGYLRDRGAGFEKSLWNCKLYPQADQSQCMRVQVLDDTPPVPRPTGPATSGDADPAHRPASLSPPALSGVRRKDAVSPQAQAASTPSPPAATVPAARASTPAPAQPPAARP